MKSHIPFEIPSNAGPTSVSLIVNGALFGDKILIPCECIYKSVKDIIERNKNGKHQSLILFSYSFYMSFNRKKKSRSLPVLTYVYKRKERDDRQLPKT